MNFSHFPPKTRPLIWWPSRSTHKRPGFWREMPGIHFSISDKRWLQLQYSNIFFKFLFKYYILGWNWRCCKWSRLWKTWFRCEKNVCSWSSPIWTSYGAFRKIWNWHQLYHQGSWRNEGFVNKIKNLIPFSVKMIYFSFWFAFAQKFCSSF